MIDGEYGYTECRSFGHAWKTNPGRMVRNTFGVVVTLICDRCHSERIDTFSFHGRLIQRRYVRPDDYGISANDTMTTEMWRAKLIARLIVTDVIKTVVEDESE